MIQIDTIQFARVQPGYWVLVTISPTGTQTVRPVVAVRKGRNWIVQAPSTDRTARLEEQYGAVRTLNDAKSLMIAVWLKLDSARKLAHYEAMEDELARLNREARALKITFPIFHEDTPLGRRIAFVRELISRKHAGSI